ncbi:MAG TPA: response regulator [Phycisphaerales bacterium]|nr:response regulator [Phycisphaerales bacterium]
MSEQHHILLVEDSKPQAMAMKAILESAGWSVTHAETAELALDSLKERRPDLVLIDFYLPGVRGDELCRQIRLRLDTHQVPVVILTGDTGQDLEARGLDSGADGFISKSVSQDVLLLRLRSLLTKSTAGREPAPPTEAHTARVLAVDDSSTYLTYLKAQLVNEGYSVDTATSGAEALRLIEAGRYDCALVDLVMPGMDGIDLCARVNAWRLANNQSLMVLMLTASEDNQNLARAFEAGADDFVGKSSEFIVIRGRIRALLRRKFYDDEHRRMLSAELRAQELETEHAKAQEKAAEARAVLAEELARSADALRRSNEDLQQFAYVASHDLQEPLRMVSSYVQLLERRYKDKLGGEALEFMEFILDGTRRMKTLINDLLSYSRIETRGQGGTPVNLEECLRDALRNVQASINESGAQVTHDPLPTLSADRGQMVQLFQNLVGNAIKYRGTETPKVHIAARQENGEHLFSVQDNGIGIEKQYWERVFIIFQRLHNRTEYPGTGIGLAICKKIVDRHGGRIWVDSEIGRGSTFHFVLPPTKSSAVEAAA